MKVMEGEGIANDSKVMVDSAKKNWRLIVPVKKLAAAATAVQPCGQGTAATTISV